MKKGFTLIELVIVIVILGILAAVAIPKYIDLTGQAKQSAAKGGLGAIRAVVALKYANNLATGASSTAAYPTSIVAGDFFDGKLPVNQLAGTAATSVEVVTVVPTGTGTGSAAAIGWWYINPTVTASAGRAGAYSDGTVDTANW